MEYTGNDFYCDIALKDIAALKKEYEIEQETGQARIQTNLGTSQDSKHLHFHIVSGPRLD